MPVENHAEWEAQLQRVALGVTAAELHGAVTGFLCAGWGGPARELLAALVLDCGDAGLDALLERAAAAIAGRFRNGEPVAILLPAGSVAVRANATVDWCRGLLGGLGLTGVVEECAHDPVTRGLLHDLAEIAAHRLEARAEDAAALVEVLRFIRGAVAHLHATLAPGAAP